MACEHPIDWYKRMIAEADEAGNAKDFYNYTQALGNWERTHGTKQGDNKRADSSDS